LYIGKNKYLKLVYSSKFPSLKIDIDKNEKIKHVFGAEASMLELFILKSKIKGPKWIKLKSKSFENNNSKLSWCKYEIICNNLKNIEILERESPKLKLMSLKFGTIFNEEKKNNEILSVSGILMDGVNIDYQTDYKKLNKTKFNGIRKLEKSENMEKIDDIESFDNESTLLDYILNKVENFDPDIICGHNFLSYDLDIFLHRIKEKNIKNWSRIGRLKKKELPKLQKGAGNNFYLLKECQIQLLKRKKCYQVGF
jgi:DNA polymerase alpha subunit A